MFRTDFDKIACDNLIPNYAFKSAFPNVYFKSIVKTPFLAELKNPLTFLKKVENAKSVRTDQGQRVAPFESSSGLLKKTPKGSKNLKKIFKEI